jgi:protein-S-isoprenylcysteine O-methyltransferase Ste14
MELKRRFLGSPAAVRIGSASLAAFVIVYTLMVSVSRLSGGNSARDYMVLGTLWLLALIALVLLARAWRAARRRNAT